VAAVTAAVLRDTLRGAVSAAKVWIKIGKKNPGGGNFDDRIATRPLT